MAGQRGRMCPYIEPSFGRLRPDFANLRVVFDRGSAQVRNRFHINGQIIFSTVLAASSSCVGDIEPQAPPSCQRPNPCAGEAAPTTAAVLVAATDTTAPVLRVESLELPLGITRRVDVQTSLGFGQSTDGNDFRQVHCDLGLQLQYVDDTRGDDFDGVPNGDDILVRVVTTPGSPSTLANGNVMDGSTLAQAQQAIDGQQIDRAGATLLLSADTGVSAFIVNGVVDHLGLFIPQTQVPWDLPFDLDRGSVGQETGGIRTRDSSMRELPGLLGTPTAEGIAQGDTLLIDAWISTWPALGIRGAGACPVIGTCDATVSLTSILLSSPYMGSSDSGLGLWSTKEDVDAHFGSSGTPIDGLVVYSSTTDVAFAYTDASDCSLRVAGIVLDYRASP